MGEPLSIVNRVVGARVPVQIVIAMLLLSSLYSWMIIFRKRMVIGRSRREAEQFENQFWSGGDLAQLYRAIERFAPIVEGRHRRRPYTWHGRSCTGGCSHATSATDAGAS